MLEVDICRAPARDTSTLYKNIRVRRVVGELAILATVKAPGVGYLDDPDYLNRPFFRYIVYKYFNESFTLSVKKSVGELLEINNG